MNRREILKTGIAGAASLAIGGQNASSQEEPGATKAAGKPGGKLAPACGLYCGICADHQSGECHGCGCDCGRCAGQAHAAQCATAHCAASRKIESCADCAELPCTKLIQFAFDPIWRTHGVCIENLRRRKQIGTARWLAEQAAYWKDEQARRGWAALYEECSVKWRQAKSRQASP